MRSLLLTAVILATSALAWGPASHYWFTCSVLHKDNMKGCVANHQDLLSGAEMPDAMFFGDFTSGAVPGQLYCAGLGALHNPFFAGVMVQLAINDSIANPSGTCYNVSDGSYKAGYNAANCFNAYEFGIGFGAHCVADISAFAFPNAYIGNGYTQNASTVDWVSIWPFMTAVDAHVIQKQFPTGTQCPSNILSLSSTASDFLARANAKLVELYPQLGYPTADSSKFAECANLWSRAVKNECAKSQVLPATSYGFELTYNDHYGASSASQAVQNFELAQNCAIKGIALWKSAIEAPGGNPYNAAFETVEAFYSWFAKGECAPVPLTNPPRAKTTGVGAGHRGSDKENVVEMLKALSSEGTPFPEIHDNHYLRKMGWLGKRD